MSQQAIINQPAPELQVDTWVQGDPVTLAELQGKIVLVEVFQVNCPGCFLHALPEVIRLHELFDKDEFTVIGLATAFEDFDWNTLDNLKRLIEKREVVGAPLQQLGAAGLLQGNLLDYRLPFRIGMDTLVKSEADLSDSSVNAFICGQIADFDTWPEYKKLPVQTQARNYLSGKTHRALTFETYRLQGTPSSILIDQQGILRDIAFGWANHLEARIRDLLKT
jgi:hypothetical protein